MSIQAVAWVLEHSQSTGSARLVLISLANHASEANRWECWPASRTAAKEAAVKSHATVLTATKHLVELGEVEIIDPGGPRRPCRYRLTFMDERSESDHNSGSNGQKLTAAVSPGRPQRSVQTDQNRKEPEPNRNSEPDGSLDREFSEIWEHYPRRIARTGAFKAYRARRREGVPGEDLARAVKNYTASLARRGTAEEFVLHGATFFGPNKRWEDYLDATPGKPRMTDTDPAYEQALGRALAEGYPPGVDAHSRVMELLHTP